MKYYYRTGLGLLSRDLPPRDISIYGIDFRVITEKLAIYQPHWIMQYQNVYLARKEQKLATPVFMALISKSYIVLHDNDKPILKPFTPTPTVGVFIERSSRNRVEIYLFNHCVKREPPRITHAIREIEKVYDEVFMGKKPMKLITFEYLNSVLHNFVMRVQ